MASGAPFQDPPDAVVTRGPGGDPTVTLDARDTAFDLSGKGAVGQSYNGSFVAPTIHFSAGANVEVRLVNHLSVATNLHFHGLHVAPADHADDPYLCVAPGHSLTYHLRIPADHPQGTYWYHSHAMGTTCPAPTNSATSGAPTTAKSSEMPPMPGDVENQIFAGLSGALIVGDDRTLLPPDLRDVVAHTFVLKDVQIDSTDHIVQNTATTSIDSDDPTVRLVNGQLRPTLTMRAGQTQLWRFVNAGADIFYRLHSHGYRFTSSARTAAR